MFARYGKTELIQYTSAGLALAALGIFGLSCWVSPWLGWPLAIVGFCFAGFTLYFFRDPHRELSGDAFDIVAPADGKITDIVVGDGKCSDFIDGQCHMIGIFLSVFDVHVNRAPLDGKVAYLRYKAGKFLDARDPDCGRLNEQQVIGIQNDTGMRFVVKQIAGLIARRIVCELQPEQEITRGERFGMIKFGSRTELWIDAAAADIEWKVKIGDAIKGGETLLGRITPREKDNENASGEA